MDDRLYKKCLVLLIIGSLCASGYFMLSSATHNVNIGDCKDALITIEE